MLSDTSTSTLGHLHDIVFPEPVSWVPQTVGWWAALVLVGLLLGWVGYATYNRWQANRYRRLALNQLRQIEAELCTLDRRVTALLELPVLMKQTVLACWKRSDVASLTGEDWLRFLDESYCGKGFTQGPGRLLPTLAYSPPSTLHQLSNIGSDEVKKLIVLIREWIQHHRV
jgi:hypothetical protein